MTVRYLNCGFRHVAPNCRTRFHLARRRMAAMRTGAGLVAFVCVAFASGSPATAAAGNASPAQLSQVERLLADAESAEKTGNLNLALIQLKNAALLQPENGEIRARLGMVLLRTGQAANAERELRQAYKDYGPPELVVPGLLNTMLQRKEFKELLAEYPDPRPGTEDRTTPDVLSARAFALQMSGQPKDARAAMDHSLALRHDAAGLVASARLAQQQNDSALAASQADEAVRLSPSNEAAWTMKISLAGAGGDLGKALAGADDFLHEMPHSALAQVMRIEILVALKEDAKAKAAVASLLTEQPKSLYGQYFNAVLMMRAKDNAGAWRLAQSLPPGFVQSRAAIARTVAAMAQASGNAESAGAILTQLVATQPEDRLARLQLATLRLSQKSPQEALNLLEPLKTSNDPSAQAVLAQAYLALGRFDEAMSALETANKAPRANPLLERELALLQLRAGEGDRAVEELRESVQRDPDNLQLSAALIGALLVQKKSDEALATADRMAQRAPASPLPAFYRGQILTVRGDIHGAAAEYGKSLAKDPKFLPALFYRANASAGIGEFESAKTDLQVIIGQQPANWAAWSKLIQIAVHIGRDQDALSLFDQAIKAGPQNPAPRLALANYLMTRGKFPEAQSAVAGLLQIAADNPDALALEGQIQLQRGQTSDAVATFRRLAAGKTSSPAAYDLLARALYAAKDLRGAEDTATKATELAPASPEARRVLVDLQIAGGKGETALASAQTFATANPGPDADLMLSYTLLRLKRGNEAEALLKRTLAAKPDARIAVALSDLYQSAGKTADAKAVLADWIKRNPDDGDVRSRYAGLTMASGDAAGARAAYEELLKLRPDDPVALNNLATLLQKTDPTRALALASTAAKIAPQSAEIADTLGWIKYQHGDNQGAFPALQHAHDLETGNPAISYHYAVALRANGKPVEAKNLLQTTLAKNPNFDGLAEAKEALAHW